MKVLITGISGLLGRIVAKDVYMAGYEVIGVSRDKSKLKFNFPVKIENLDLTELLVKKNLLHEIDVVIHCAANTSMGSLENPIQNKLNTESVQNLIDLSIESSVSRFILISSANTLAPGDKKKPGSEVTKMEISTENLNYINSKIKAENTLIDAVRNRGLNGIILNPTFILNPLANDQSSNKLLEYGLNKSVLFYPRGGKSIVDVRDVSRAILTAFEKGKTGENYILSNQNFSYREFYKSILSVQNRKALLIPIPAWLILTLGGIGTILERLLRKQFNLNLKTARLLNSNHYYHHNKAREDLNYNPRSILETIKLKITDYSL